jgi:hypothetical protein
MSFAYSSFFDAARIRDGFVVASWGLYLEMVAKSPESQTTVYSSGVSAMDSQSTCMATMHHGGVKHTVPEAFNWSRELDMMDRWFQVLEYGQIGLRRTVCLRNL